MGRYYYDKKTTVEECKTLSIQFLRKQGYFKGSFISGEVRWTRNGNPNGTIGIIVDNNSGQINFNYITTNNETQVETHKKYSVKITTTPCNFGGVRRWFECWKCTRRVGVLYLYGSNDFLCRHCLNLSYDSRNDNKRFRGYQKFFDLEKIWEKTWNLKKKYYRGKDTKTFIMLQKRASYLSKGSKDFSFRDH